MGDAAVNRADEPAPLLTVAMPVYNAGKDLRLAVLSIIAQTFRDWELLLIDDGSTDNAVQDIKSIGDARIRIIRDGKNRGLAARLNEAIDMARGRYFARMDQDDVSYPTRFERQLELLSEDSTLDVVAVQGITISDNDEISGLMPCPVTNSQISARPWQGFCFPHPTWMGHIEWFKKHRYAQPGPYFCEDQELMLRSYRQSRFAAVDEILFAYRVREVSHLQKVLKTRWTFLKIQMRYFCSFAFFHYVFLACMVAIALIGRDIWWRMKRMMNRRERPVQVIEAREREHWRQVYAQIVQNAESTVA